MINRLLAAVVLISSAYGQADNTRSSPRSGADRLAEPRNNVEEQYRTWQNLQAKVNGELRKLKDPCNRNLIVGLMAPLKKEAKSYFDKRAAYLAAYYEERGRAAEGTDAFFAAAEPTLRSYELAKAAQEQLLAGDRARLESLPPEAGQARQALERAIVMEQENLEKIARHLEARKVDQGGGAARAAFDAQQEGLKAQLKLVNEDAELVETKYDSQVSRYDQACVSIPMGDPSPARTAPKKKL